MRIKRYRLDIIILFCEEMRDGENTTKDISLILIMEMSSGSSERRKQQIPLPLTEPSGKYTCFYFHSYVDLKYLFLMCFLIMHIFISQLSLFSSFPPPFLRAYRLHMVKASKIGKTEFKAFLCPLPRNTK